MNWTKWEQISIGINAREIVLTKRFLRTFFFNYKGMYCSIVIEKKVRENTSAILFSVSLYAGHMPRKFIIQRSGYSFKSCMTHTRIYLEAEINEGISIHETTSSVIGKSI